MKKLFIILALAFVGSVYSQTLYPLKPKTGGKHIKLWSADVNLDTAEIDTSTYYYDVRHLVRNAGTTVLGTFGVKCQDSSGTDTMDVTLTIYGNYSVDANDAPEGVWTSIGTVAITHATGVLTEGVDALSTDQDPLFIYATLTNDETGAGAGAGEKSTCTDVFWNVRYPTTQYSKSPK